MFKIMSYSAFILVILLFLCHITSQQTLPPKAVNAERIQLLKDALSWMTFRKNGELASDKDLTPFFEVLKDRYMISKYYRTMIIAFTRGVLPKLTLKENDPCDPAYTLEYKDSFNNSVTDGQLKKFILSSYDKRREENRQFCDYREGLICDQKTSKCECPFGSTMEPISQGSAVKRCLLQENQICTLIDLDHDPSSNYGALKKHLPEMVFNLEKPLSCQLGTQCRFKSTTETTPLCYKSNNGPWATGKWDVEFGEECTLGLYSNTGQCVSADLRTAVGSYTCFNYGPRSRPRSPQVGICSLDIGSYAITSYSGWDYKKGNYWELQMIGFVSPATTPLRGKRLYDYYKEHMRKLEGYLANWNGNSAMAPTAGERCNIEKTEKLLKLWLFYKNLEETPPPGQDYAATEAELEAKFKEAEDLTVDLDAKMCRANTMLFRNSYIYPALRCVRNSTDSAGNNGRCEVIPESEDVTYSWAQSFLQFRNHIARTSYDEYYQETDYRKDIYEPDLECDPKLGPPPGSLGAASSTDTDVLEGGYCPPDRGCFEDYADYLDIYDNDKDCNLKDAKPRLFRNCQDLDEKRKYDNCEYTYLNNRFKEDLQTLSTNGGLKRGDACKHDLEAKIRYWIKKGGTWIDGNKYQKLIELNNLKNGKEKLCDRTKLLQCSKSGTCECLPGTQPREVSLEAGRTIFSDYCYLTSGDCDPWDQHFIFDESSQIEKNEINRHYKAREGEGGSLWSSSCKASNWCVYVDATKQSWKVKCTTENTGNTGHNGSDPVTTTTTTTARSTTRRRRTTTDRNVDESKLMCKGNCGWQDAGATKNGIHVLLQMMALIQLQTYIL